MSELTAGQGVILDVTPSAAVGVQVMGESFAERVAGRVLCSVAPYTVNDVEVVTRAAALTAGHPASGMVVRGRHTTQLLGLCGARFGEMASPGAARQLVIADPGYWTSTVATPDAPMMAPSGEDALFVVSADEQIGSLLGGGADAALTPSGFVRAGDWPTLKAVLVAGAQVRDPRVATLVATDAAMLDPARLATFLDRLAEQRPGRALAFVFASTSMHLGGRGRMAGLRELLGAFPGSLIVGTEVLAATDVVVHGGAAAIGLLASHRRPRPPGGKGGGPQAAGFIPGMFLRELWETRSPSIYVDWYRNRPAPFCEPCGRGPERFTTDQADKDAVLLHNVHAWLDVLTDLDRAGEHARTMLSTERWEAWDAHRDLGRPGTPVKVDELLLALCKLEGPPQHRVPAAIR